MALADPPARASLWRLIWPARVPGGVRRTARVPWIPIVIDGGKMLQSAGGGANTQAMIDWTDEQWEAIRPKRK